MDSKVDWKRSGTLSIWRLLTSEALSGSIAGPALLNIFINDLDNGTDFAEGTKQGGGADAPAGCTDI